MGEKPVIYNYRQETRNPQLVLADPRSGRLEDRLFVWARVTREFATPRNPLTILPRPDVRFRRISGIVPPQEHVTQLLQIRLLRYCKGADSPSANVTYYTNKVFLFPESQ